MPRTALFVIDIQVGMAQDLEHEVPHAARIREVGRAILQKARTAINSARLQHLDPSLGIIIVQHYEKDETELLVKGKREWELVFKPENETERVVEKNDGDTFQSNPQLADDLKAQGVEQIVAFGLCSQMCVLSTCQGALAAGFKVLLLRGAHSTYDEDGQKAEEIEQDVEKTLRREGVEVIPWNEWHP